VAKVRVFSTATCPWCVKAKAYLKQNNIEFEDIDVSKDATAAEEMIKKSGQRGVPVIEIDEKVIVGFDKGAIDSSLSL